MDSPFPQDPHLEACLQHLQNAEWQEAIQCLEDLQKRYPENETIQNALEKAQIKADLDSVSHIKPRRWDIPIGRYLISAGIIFILIAFIITVFFFINRNILPAIAKTRNERQVQILLEQGWDYLNHGQLDRAEEIFNKAGTLAPDDPKVLNALSAIKKQRQAEILYTKAVRAQNQGQYDQALRDFMDYITQTADHHDAPQRIQEIRRQQELATLFNQAEKAYQARYYEQAIKLFKQLRAIDRTYERKLVSERLYSAYMNLGYATLNTRNVSAVDVQRALDYFKEALIESPGDIEAAQEKNLAELYLKATKAIENRQWQIAAFELGAISQQHPHYLQGRIPAMLYEVLIKSGDVYKTLGDLPQAYEQYRKACELLVKDRTLCKARLNEVAPLITPTVTPTVTPTPTPTPTITPTPTPAPFTPTPQPLPMLKGKIAFYSDNPDKPGIWVMDPTGKHRHFYGSSNQIRLKFDSMFAHYRLSPDGAYRAYVTKGPNDKNPQIYIQGQVNQYGTAPTWEVTKDFSRVCYDPMWSPDGAKLVFVSEERGSDDVWVINIDGSNAVDLTPNNWEWDKHPSWSPDGRHIVFWSNRTGIKNIYVMDADGRNVRNISNTTWNEWKPLWIR